MVVWAMGWIRGSASCGRNYGTAGLEPIFTHSPRVIRLSLIRRTIEMTGKEFFNKIANSEVDMVELLLAMLHETETDYCVIGGLAVNAYAEPVVSLDLDLVVVSARIPELAETARSAGMKVEEFEHSVNLSIAGSDLRVQLQKDPRYQEFISRAHDHSVLGYELSVASVEDVLAGKVWAFSDRTRRASKRQKDLADIMRLVETHPELRDSLPEEIAVLLD